MNIVIYNNITKNSIRWANVPDIAHADIQCGQQESWIEGLYKYGCYIENDVLKYRLEQPTEYHKFDEENKTWVVDIDSAKLIAKSAINKEAGRIITEHLPQWKQVNLTARAVELQSKAQDLWTDLESTEWVKIQNDWGYVKAVRAESNRVNALIDSAQNVDEIISASLGAFQAYVAQ